MQTSLAVIFSIIHLALASAVNAQDATVDTKFMIKDRRLGVSILICSNYSSEYETLIRTKLEKDHPDLVIDINNLLSTYPLSAVVFFGSDLSYISKNCLTYRNKIQELNNILPNEVSISNFDTAIGYERDFIVPNKYCQIAVDYNKSIDLYYFFARTSDEDDCKTLTAYKF